MTSGQPPGRAPEHASVPVPRSLALKRAAARAALWFEQLWPAAWPALGVLGTYAALALLDAPALLPPWPRLLLPVLVLALAAGLLWRGLRRVARPSDDAADRRLERATGLRHRPLSALQDRPAAATAEAGAVWRVHQERLRRQVRRLRVGRPRPGLAARDLRASRAFVLVALAAALVVAGPDAPGRLLAAVLPPVPSGPAAPGTVVQAWSTPPAYTGLPPQFLQPGAAAVSVPAGSHLTVSVTGGRGTPSLALDSDVSELHALDAKSWQGERDLAGSGRLAVRRGGQELAGWALTVIPDQPPTVAFEEPPGPVLSAGRATNRVRLAWRAEDDYGVVAVGAELRLSERPDAAPLTLDAPLGGSPKQPRGAFVQDLTAHPWAGLAVTARVVAKDAAGQTGTSAEAAVTLPERAFRNPVARAVIAVRKQLSLTPDDRQPARRALDGIADRPDLFDNSYGVALNLRSLAFLIGRGRGQEAVDEAQARMWQLALALEEGEAERTARALDAARQAERDAVDAARQDPADAAKQAELERRTQELRDAIQRHLEALAEQARRDGTELPLDQAAPEMNARDLDQMAKDVQEAARQGKMDEARDKLADLEKLLQQLQNARPEHGEEREKRNAEKRKQGQEQVDALQDIVRREGGLLDRSKARQDAAAAEARRVPPAPPATPPSPGQAAPSATPEAQAQEQRDADQRSQKALRRALGELMQRFGDLTGKVPPPLGEADVAMREAGQAMAQAQDGAAGAAQQRVIEALQKGGQAMGQQMAQQFGRGDQQQGQGEEGQDGQEGQQGQAGDGTDGPDGNGRGDGLTNGTRPGRQQRTGRRQEGPLDPLGRSSQQGSGGNEESDSTKVPGQRELARTQALQDELRRRGAERSRPKPELDYIDRLLKPF